MPSQIPRRLSLAISIVVRRGCYRLRGICTWCGSKSCAEPHKKLFVRQAFAVSWGRWDTATTLNLLAQCNPDLWKKGDAS